MEPLNVQNLDFAYGEKRVLKGVGFSVDRGQFCGLLGPNGAGKSTLFSLLASLLPAPAGHVHVAGFDIANQPRAALSEIGIVFQQPTLELDMSVEQNMRYFAALHGLAGQETEDRISHCLELVRMNERRKEKVRALNGGHKRRMEIARALIHEPQVLLLDEATVGLDVPARKAIVEDVHALAQGGMSVLWATHLVDEIWPDDQVVILHQGEVRAAGNAQAVVEGSTLLQAFLKYTESQVESLI